LIIVGGSSVGLTAALELARCNQDVDRRLWREKAVALRQQ
jgi:thioredoxin reductase